MPSITFTPDRSEDLTFLLLGLAAALIGYFIAWRLYRRPGTGDQLNRRLLGAMLLGFLATMGLGTAVFSGWKLCRLVTIEVKEAGLRMGEADLPYADIRHASLRQDRTASFVNPQLTTRSTQLLVIETRQGKTYVLSERNYPVNRIMGEMRERIRGQEGSD